MQAPSLAEFKHLYDVNAADHDGFPPPVIHNKALFTAALERMSPPRREALWRHLRGRCWRTVCRYRIRL